MNIYNSRFAKHFVRHQGMVSISTMRFVIWFENRSQPLLITDTVKHSGKDHEKNFKSLVAVSTLHKLEYIFVWDIRHMEMAISSHSNEQSLVSYNKRPSQEHWMGCSDIISQPQSLTL